jgi:maltose O-acetyltransferase
MYGAGEIICGKDSYVSDMSTLQASPGLKISIGRGVMIANNVRIFTQTVISDCDFSLHPIPKKVGSVIIEDYAWVGSNVYIGPGVSIGENSVVGANSFVTSSIPSGEVWGGIPARLIKIKSFRTLPGR